MAHKLQGDVKITRTVFLDGRPISHGFLSVDGGGKTLTFVSWLPSKPDDKETAVYEKQ